MTEIIDATTGQVTSQSFGAWGQPRQADDWTQRAVDKLMADRGFTGHEHLPSVFGLIDMNGRMYDPVIGRFLSPDPYVQAPDYAQNFNRYGYCLNNPLVYTDPDGEWFLLAAAVVFLVTTDVGYECQKYISPVAVKIDVHLSGEQRGIGANVSVGVPKSYPISYRKHWGATYYWHYYDDMFTGWETRNGGEWTVGGMINHSQTHFNTSINGVEDGFDQTTGMFTLGGPFVNLKYENDQNPNFMSWLPGLPDYDSNEDRWRSGAAQLNVFGLKAGVNIVNGQRSFKINDEEKRLDEDGFYNEVEPYRAGVWYVGVGSLRFGRNSENFRAKVQNTIHSYDWVDDHPYRPDPDFNNRFYWYFGTGSGNTLW